MNFSTTIIAVILNLLVNGLPYLGIVVGGDELETTVKTIVAVATGLWIWIERVKKGDVSASGFRK